MAEGRICKVFVDFDGTIEKSAVKRTIEEHIPLPLKGRALEVATNMTFTVYDVLGLGRQCVMNDMVSGRKLEMNGPVLNLMYDCSDKGMEVSVLTRNNKVSYIDAALRERGIHFKVQHTEDKVAFVHEQQIQNPDERTILLDDSIRDALRFLSKRVDGYVLYVNGHNGIAAQFLKPFIRTATDASLKGLIRESGAKNGPMPFALKNSEKIAV